ncbi:MAG: AsmA family protein [Gemmatimonadales bacterium]|nr:MAG: AsmA family protein [Gemmatimonadales bacterium]
MPRARRRWIRRLLWIAGVGAALLIAGSFVLSRVMDPDRLARWLEPRIETAVNREVSVGAVEVGFLPLAVRLREISISDPTGLAQELAALERLELRVRLVPLLRREIQVREIRLEGLAANLRVGADGLNNFGDFSPEEVNEVGSREETDEGEAQPFSLQLDGIRVVRGGLTYESVKDSLRLSVTELDTDAAVSRHTGGPWMFDGGSQARVSLTGAASRAALLPDLSGVPIRLRVAAEASEDFGELQIHEGSLEVGEVGLALSGRAGNLKDPVRDVELSLRARGVPLADLFALLPDSVLQARELQAGGTLSANIGVRGPLGPDTVPAVEGTVEVESGALQVGRTALLESVSAVVEVFPDRSLRPRVQGSLLGGDLNVDGLASLGEAPQLDLRIHVEPILERIGEDLLPPDVTLHGRLPSQVRVVGDPLDLPSLRFWGDLGIRDVEVRHPGLGVPARVATATLALAGNQATLSPTTVVLGRDPVEVRGTLMGLEGLLDGAIPEFRGSASGHRISLVELRAEPAADTVLTYGRVAFARVGGRSVRGRSAEAAAEEMGLRRPVRLPLAGEIRVAMDTVLDRRGRMEDVLATVVFGPDFLQVTDATFRRYGGLIRTNAALELGDEGEEPFSLQLVAQGVDAGAFLGETTPLGRAVRGTLDLNVDLAGGLDGLLLPARSSLQGSGSFSLRGGGLDPGPLGERLATFLGRPALAAPTVQDWSTAFVLRDGRIVLQEARMQGAPGTPRVGGGVGLDGDLDLVTAFDLPREELGATVLDRLGLGAGTTGGEMVSAVLRVGGNLGDPALRADPQATVSSVAEAVEDRARDELEQAVQERQLELRERATGFLRGLLGGRDTAQAPPPDTLRADTITPDSVPPDTLQPDTVRADTTRPDTVVLARFRRRAPRT